MNETEIKIKLDEDLKIRVLDGDAPATNVREITKLTSCSNPSNAPTRICATWLEIFAGFLVDKDGEIVSADRCWSEGKCVS